MAIHNVCTHVYSVNVSGPFSSMYTVISVILVMVLWFYGFVVLCFALKMGLRWVMLYCMFSAYVDSEVGTVINHNVLQQISTQRFLSIFYEK